MSSPTERAASYRIDLPWRTLPLSGNSRLHWAARHKVTAEIRQTVAWLGKAARLPTGEHLTVRLVWAPGDRRRRDADNCHAFVKVCVDALARGPRKDLAGLDLVADDTPRYVTVLEPWIVPPPAERGMWLAIEVRGAQCC